MIRFLCLGSGSKGNATLIYDETTLFQIDMGLPFSRIKEGLKSIERKKEDIQAILITHEHVDHVGTLAVERNVPVFASEGTLPHPNTILVQEKPFKLGDFEILPFPVSHDAANPTGFLIKHGEESLVYVTDTGYLSEADLFLMKGATYYIIESNHDYKMLLHSHRPASLKHRIHSDVGHLSNSDSAHYLVELVDSNTKGIYLAHLSEECNTPELAKDTYVATFEKEGVYFPSDKIICLKQWESVLGGDL
jgi:Metal-dependent hydrolases of the beta-lactamase superfamily I